MKKIFSILAIAFVSLNFVSCRQDDVTSDVDAMTQEQVAMKKAVDAVTADSIKVNVVAENAAGPPKDPPKDRTGW